MKRGAGADPAAAGRGNPWPQPPARLRTCASLCPACCYQTPQNLYSFSHLDGILTSGSLAGSVEHLALLWCVVDLYRQPVSLAQEPALETIAMVFVSVLLLQLLLFMFPPVAASFLCSMRFPFKATFSPRHYDDQDKKRLLEPSLGQRMLGCLPPPWLQLAFCWPVGIFDIFVISECNIYTVILKELMSPVTAACSAFAGSPSSPHWRCAYSCFDTNSLLPAK